MSFDTLFSLSNLLVMPFWFLMIFLPHWRWTIAHRRVALDRRPRGAALHRAHPAQPAQPSSRCS